MVLQREVVKESTGGFKMGENTLSQSTKGCSELSLISRDTVKISENKL